VRKDINQDLRFLFYTFSVSQANHTEKEALPRRLGKPFIMARPTVLAETSLILLGYFLSADYASCQPRSRFAVRSAQG
jgi:hypothetical protein